MEVVPTGTGVGAEIRGIDIRQPQPAATITDILAAWLEHQVFIVRRQPMTHQQHLDFTRHFGELELTGYNLFTANYTKDRVGNFDPTIPPEMSIISNIVIDGKPIGSLGYGEALWHTDSSLVECPPAGGFLRSVEVPPAGGSTHFMDMYEVLDRLPDRLRQQIEGRKILHPASHTSAGEPRKGFEHVDDITKLPGTQHPIVRTHPGTGRQALYLGRRKNSSIVDMALEESEMLLDTLWAHAVKHGPVYQHDWTVGDLVVWDNRCVMHRRDAFDPNARRLMHRTNIKGERPF